VLASSKKDQYPHQPRQRENGYFRDLQKKKREKKKKDRHLSEVPQRSGFVYWGKGGLVAKKREQQDKDRKTLPSTKPDLRVYYRSGARARTDGTMKGRAETEDFKAGSRRRQAENRKNSKARNASGRDSGFATAVRKRPRQNLSGL